MSESASTEPAAPSTTAGRARVFRIESAATFTYQFNAKLQANANYHHGVDYLPVLIHPVLMDNARIELAGLISRRVDVLAAAGYAHGASALDGGARDLETRTGEVRVRYALKRSVAFYSEYRYFFYNLREQAKLTPDLPSVFEQHVVRAGLMFFVKALGR